jgi:serine/threonine protein kinase
MALTIGTQLGSHEIIALLGKGGMGEVYRARDLKLKREVAIKILPEEFAHDSDRVNRFHREAEVLASLNHPNIAAIYDLQEASGSRYLVLELVEGETLADRIAGGPIPVEEALTIGKSICEALEAAHEKGIVHRDLKPANIKLTKDGAVKVLDFGLARTRETEGAATNLSNSPTLMSAASTPGTIMGTAAYMSPEQANGAVVDHRTDIFSFGVVLYEMLTGTRAFPGERVGEILARVMERDPDWNRLPSKTPASIRRLLRRCLEKEHKQRLQHIGDARIEIDEERASPDGSDILRNTRTRKERLLWMSALAFVVLIAAVAMFAVRRPVPDVPALSEMRLDITTPPTSDPQTVAISPDGEKIVFAATSEGRSQLWLRLMASTISRPLRGTDGASQPFWSPDSRSVAFFADSKLKRIEVNDGSLQTLAPAQGGQGGTWNRDGMILFVPRTAGSILRVSANGGETSVVVEAKAFFNSPQFLPDGHHFLYSVGPCFIPPCEVFKRLGTYVGQLDGSSENRYLIDAPAQYVSSGHLLFKRSGTLFAQKFDPNLLQISGNPLPVSEGVQRGPVSFSNSGAIVYRAGGANVRAQAVWFDRSGKKMGMEAPTPLMNMVISPDGRRVAMNDTVNQNQDVYIHEIGSSGPSTRLTFHPGNDLSPVWSPDGRQIAFASGQGAKEGLDLYRKAATGAGNDEQLLEIENVNLTPMDWSPDGRFLLFRQNDPKTGFDLWALPSDGDRKPFPVIRGEADEQEGQFSPDGKWIAYQSNESGRFEIYVQPFGALGKVNGKWQISTDGGAQVRWRPDGKELFFIALDGQLMAVPIRVVSDGHAIERGSPVALFSARVWGGPVPSVVFRQQYAVSRDGQRFLVNTITEEVTSPITAILNWHGGLSARESR